MIPAMSVSQIFSLLVLISCRVQGAEMEEPSRSVHRPGVARGLPHDSVRLGVFFVVHPNIGNGSVNSNDFEYYCAALAAGVNIKLMKTREPIVKLGLLGLHQLNESEQIQVSKNGTVDLEEAWKVVQDLKQNRLRAREADIVYLLTGDAVDYQSTSQYLGATSVRGACTENNIAVGTDILWSYGGADVFAQNIAGLLGADSFECSRSDNDIFSDCRIKHMKTFLNSTWPYCYGHATFTDWIFPLAMHGDRLNRTSLCEYKTNKKGSIPCKSQNENSSGDSMCEISCCPSVPRSSSEVVQKQCRSAKCKRSALFSLPDGVVCKNSTYDSEKGACYSKGCKRWVALRDFAAPSYNRRLDPNFPIFKD